MKTYTLLIGTALVATVLLAGNEIYARDFNMPKETRTEKHRDFGKSHPQRKPGLNEASKIRHDGRTGNGYWNYRPCQDTAVRAGCIVRPIHIPGTHCNHGTPCRDIVQMSYPPRTVHIPGTFCNHQHRH